MNGYKSKAQSQIQTILAVSTDSPFLLKTFVIPQGSLSPTGAEFCWHRWDTVGEGKLQSFIPLMERLVQFQTIIYKSQSRLPEFPPVSTASFYSAHFFKFFCKTWSCNEKKELLSYILPLWSSIPAHSAHGLLWQISWHFIFDLFIYFISALPPCKQAQWYKAHYGQKTS